MGNETKTFFVFLNPLLFMAKIFIVIGLIFLVAGLLLHFFPSIFKFLGHLPGDFHWHSEHISFSFPLASSLLISVLLSLLFYFFRK
jgi:hypothetical protein